MRHRFNAWHQKAVATLGTRWLGVLFLALAFALGLVSGYLLGGYSPSDPGNTPAEASALSEEAPEVSASSEQISALDQLNLPDHYPLPMSYLDIGPQLLAAGAIDYDNFLRIYDEAGQPLTQEQQDILTKGSDAPIVINRENAYFLLNFFWALGLTNHNVLLEEGPMMQYSEGNIERFASTGGWTLATKSVTELYASTPIITLTSKQQARLEEVAYAVYRPCCNNSTAFPDCNHGMAMLGLLELMAAHDATVDEMFTAAKYVNAFWFPQQTVEIALAFKRGKGLAFAEVDARELVSANFSSSTGFRAVHQWLAENNLLQQAPGGGNSCGI